MDNGFDRMVNAVTSMAESAAPLRARLKNAWITLIPLRDEDFEPDLRQQFVELKQRMTAIQRGPEGSLATTLDQMADEELEAVAKRLTVLFEGVVYRRG